MASLTASRSIVAERGPVGEDGERVGAARRLDGRLADQRLSARPARGEASWATAGSYAWTIAPSLRSSATTSIAGESRSVLGAALERQAPDADRLALERPEAGAQPAHGARLALVVLTSWTRRQDRRRDAERLADVAQRRHVLGQAAAAVADARLEEVTADPRVVGDAVDDRGRYRRRSASHRRATSLMNETRVARNALATYLIISAVRRSVTMTSPGRPSYRPATACGVLGRPRARRRSGPGWKKSSTALPWRQELRVATRCAAGARRSARALPRMSSIVSPVPIGEVLLLMMIGDSR